MWFSKIYFYFQKILKNEVKIFSYYSWPLFVHTLYFVCCFLPSLLRSIYSVNIRFFNPSFLVINPRILSCIFLKLNINLLLALNYSILPRRSHVLSIASLCKTTFLLLQVSSSSFRGIIQRSLPYRRAYITLVHLVLSLSFGILPWLAQRFSDFIVTHSVFCSNISEIHDFRIIWFCHLRFAVLFLYMYLGIVLCLDCVCKIKKNTYN